MAQGSDNRPTIGSKSIKPMSQEEKTNYSNELQTCIKASFEYHARVNPLTDEDCIYETAANMMEWITHWKSTM